MLDKIIIMKCCQTYCFLILTYSYENNSSLVLDLSFTSRYLETPDIRFQGNECRLYLKPGKALISDQNGCSEKFNLNLHCVQIKEHCVAFCSLKFNPLPYNTTF